MKMIYTRGGSTLPSGKLLRYTLTLSIVVAGAGLSLSKTEDDGGGQNAREDHDAVVVGVALP